jgi:hypothetical protein
MHGMTQKKIVQPVTRWWRGEELARNRKVKSEDFLTIDPYKMETMVEEEDMDVLTR